MSVADPKYFLPAALAATLRPSAVADAEADVVDDVVVDEDVVLETFVVDDVVLEAFVVDSVALETFVVEDVVALDVVVV